MSAPQNEQTGQPAATAEAQLRGAMFASTEPPMVYVRFTGLPPAAAFELQSGDPDYTTTLQLAERLLPQLSKLVDRLAASGQRVTLKPSVDETAKGMEPNGEHVLIIEPRRNGPATVSPSPTQARDRLAPAVALIWTVQAYAGQPRTGRDFLDAQIDGLRQDYETAGQTLAPGTARHEVLDALMTAALVRTIENSAAPSGRAGNAGDNAEPRRPGDDELPTARADLPTEE